MESFLNIYESVLDSPAQQLEPVPIHRRPSGVKFTVLGYLYMFGDRTARVHVK